MKTDKYRKLCSLLLGVSFLSSCLETEKKDSSNTNPTREVIDQVIKMSESASPEVTTIDTGIVDLVKPSTSLFDIDIDQIGDQIITVKEEADLEMIRRNKNFGFSDEEVQQFLEPIYLKYNFSGFDKNAVTPPPPAGVHPRVLFGPDELPAIRENLSNTVPGQKVMAAIKKELDNNIRKKGSATTQGYQALIKGDTTIPIHENISIAYSAVYEAFRCLIEDDHEGGKDVAKAITTIAKIDHASFEKNIAAFKAKNPNEEFINFQNTSKFRSQNGTLGLMYDWAYRWMDEDQRDIVRKSIALASSNMTLIGAQTLRTPRTSGSNWISWTSRLVTLLAAIEGEEGYDPGSYKRSVYALKWFFALSVFPEGENIEGWGKQFLMAELAYIMAKRGEYFLALDHVRGAFKNFFLHALNPWGRTGNEGHNGGPFTFYDSQGGTNNNIQSMSDILVYKKLFPNDPYIDFIFRNSVGEDYEIFGSRPNFRHHFSTYAGFSMAIFASTFDESKTWNQALEDVTIDSPLSYYGSDTGTMITRSSWDKDALYLYSLTRNVTGGHKYSDRGHFNVYSNGRHWGIYAKMRQVQQAYWPMNRSTILVDGEGVSIAPGKSLKFIDKEHATFTVSDLKISYDMISNYLFRANDKQRNESMHFPYSYNDFRLTQSDRPTWGMPLDERPHWQTSRKPEPAPKRFAATNGWRKQPILMDKAFRTVGMVRGENPYILVVDDIKKDDQLRDYEWGMTVANDVEIFQSNKGNVVLSEKGKSKEESRFLLVNMLTVENLQGDGRIKEVVSKNPPQKDTVLPKLVFNSKSSEPKFITLICNIDNPEKQPKTSWDNNALTLSWDDQTDLIEFEQQESGLRKFKVTRNGEVIFTTQID
jgi:hypothetical protein